MSREFCCLQGELPPRPPPRVRQMAEKGDAGGLLRAPTYRHPVEDREGRILDLGMRTRLAAVEALAGLTGKQAMTGLSMALDDGEIEVRRAAIEALREHGEPAEPPLMRATTEWAHPELADLREQAV